MTEEIVVEQPEAVASLPANGAARDVVIVSASVTPMELLSRALERGADIGILEKLMDLQERHEKNEARKAFDAAMADARGEMPIIVKNRAVDFTSTKGRTNYKYEDLASVAEAVNPVLAKHGLSYRFRTTSPPNAPITVTCILSHRLGYYEENTLEGPRDDSGNKNSIQAIGSTLTYLQRMTLKAALGLAAAADDDGKAAPSTAGDEPITEEQRDELQARAEKAGADLEKFCDYLRVSSLADLTKGEFPRAVAALSAKGAKKNGAR